jgi:site-specific recombinase XerD
VAKSKLYYLTERSFALPFCVDEGGGVITRPADNFPMLTWPDGAWCLAANVYMLHLYRRGLSRRERGGTLFSYATNISHLIRYCYRRRIDFSALNDNEFSLFIKGLTDEREKKNPQQKVRDSSSVVAIGRNCLEFLQVVGDLNNVKDFVGPSGCIAVEERQVVVRKRHGAPLVRKYLHHHSFPVQDPKNKRLPISEENVSKLYAAVEKASNTLFQRKRRYVMLKVLEITGARRIEIAWLKVESVKAAAKMKEPRLKLLTAKRRGGKESYRLLPISSPDLAFLLEFIDVNRHRVVRKTCGQANDDGYVFVSETTGRRLAANTITSEISVLKAKAGITEKVCPHMFRHAFITDLFVALIEQHRFENSDQFRQALLDKEAFKREVQEWTGHVDASSLDRYIHLAFAKAANLQKTLDAIELGRLAKSLKSSLGHIQQELRDGAPPSEATRTLIKLVEAVEADLRRHSIGGTP